MPDETVPPTPPPAGGAGGPDAPPPPPPSGAAPPPGQPGQKSPNRELMVALAYAWIFVLIPYLAEKNDREVQWHSRQGLVLTIAEVAIQFILFVVGLIPVIGCITWILAIFVFLGFLVVRLIAAVKGIQGERWPIPMVADYIDKVPA